MAKEKDIKKKNVKRKEKNNKNSKEKYMVGLKKEIKQVKWPTFKEVVKYTIATVIFIIVFVVFFVLINLFMAYIKGLFN